VVGILLALKISDWNEDQKAQAELDLYIAQLKEDMRKAIAVAEKGVVATERRKKETLDTLRILGNSSDEQSELALRIKSEQLT